MIKIELETTNNGIIETVTNDVDYGTLGKTSDSYKRVYEVNFNDAFDAERTVARLLEILGFMVNNEELPYVLDIRPRVGMQTNAKINIEDLVEDLSWHKDCVETLTSRLPVPDFDNITQHLTEEDLQVFKDMENPLPPLPNPQLVSIDMPPSIGNSTGATGTENIPGIDKIKPNNEQ